MLENGTADFGTADVTISAENPIKIVAQKQHGMVVEFAVSEETVIDATSVNTSGWRKWSFYWYRRIYF